MKKLNKMKRLIKVAMMLLFVTVVKAQSLNAEKFAEAIKNKNAQILDVRTAEEFNSGYIANAFQANYNNTNEFEERVKYLDKTKPVYVYCLSGVRSAGALTELKNLGFKEVYHLQGGITAWKKMGFALAGNKIPEKLLTVTEYNKQLKLNGYTLVDFGAAWCPPCKTMEPILEQFKKENTTVKIVNIDASVQTELLKAFKVDALPVFILYKNGKQTWRKQGVVSLQELNELVKK